MMLTHTRAFRYCLFVHEDVRTSMPYMRTEPTKGVRVGAQTTYQATEDVGYSFVILSQVWYILIYFGCF